MLKLWRISQDSNSGYDTYDSAVVAAETEDEARAIHPSSYAWENGKWTKTRLDGSKYFDDYSGTWATSPDLVVVEYIGDAKEGTEKGLICASFNAG